MVRPRPVTLDSFFMQPNYGIVSQWFVRINSDLRFEMDRRTKQRLDLQLVCRIGPGRLLSAPIDSPEVLVTENFSRTGILLR